MIAIIALAVGVPLGVSMALFINEYAPAALRRPLTSVIDLLAALPSILFGMWGLFALSNRLAPIAKFLGDHLSVLPFFAHRQRAALAQSSFVAGVVVGIMIIPIIASVSRDVMAQAPREQCEGALALGGTRWGMIREVILPFGRSGIVGATLLGFGRALGETIAVALVISPKVLFNGARSHLRWRIDRRVHRDPLRRGQRVRAQRARRRRASPCSCSRWSSTSSRASSCVVPRTCRSDEPALRPTT